MTYKKYNLSEALFVSYTCNVIAGIIAVIFQIATKNYMYSMMGILVFYNIWFYVSIFYYYKKTKKVVINNDI